jgi:hypothetical protein
MGKQGVERLYGAGAVAPGAGLADAKRGVERVPGALAKDCALKHESALKRQSATRLATPASDAPAPDATAPASRRRRPMRLIRSARRLARGATVGTRFELYVRTHTPQSSLLDAVFPRR